MLYNSIKIACFITLTMMTTATSATMVGGTNELDLSDASILSAAKLEIHAVHSRYLQDNPGCNYVGADIFKYSTHFQ